MTLENVRLYDYVKGGGLFISYNQIRGHNARWMNSASAGLIDAGVKIDLTKYQ